MTVGAGSQVYSEHIEAVLKAEDDRRSAIETRGGALLASSATLIALLFALTVLITGEEFTLTSPVAVGLLFGAISAFVLSAILASYVQSWPLKQSVTSDETLRQMVQEGHWLDDTEDSANFVCANRNVNSIRSIRLANKRKIWVGVWALILQLLALAVLAGSIAAELGMREQGDHEKKTCTITLGTEISNTLQCELT